MERVDIGKGRSKRVVRKPVSEEMAGKNSNPYGVNKKGGKTK